MYTIADIAQISGRNRETVRRWIREGRLKAIGYNGVKGEKILISEEDWTNFLKSRLFCNGENKLLKKYFKLESQIQELTNEKSKILEALRELYYNKEKENEKDET